MGKDQQIYLFGILWETLRTYSLSALFAFVILLFISFYISNALLYYVGGIFLLAPLLASAVSKWRPKKRIPVDGKAVFISGCDSGFGFMLARRLDEIGFQVFAGCLFPEGDGAKLLRKSSSKRLHVLALDVTSDTSVANAVVYVNENLGDNLLWGVVNNAGIFEPGELSWISTEVVQRTIDVNTFGIVRLTKAFLLMLKKSEGRVVSVASILGHHTSPHAVPYCMSKAAVISFNDGLRLEMYKWNIQVITVEPAAYRTSMIDNGRIGNITMRMWEQVPKNVKDLYRSNPMETSLNSGISLIKYFRRHPREVVSVIEEALTTLCPEYYYRPGSLALSLLGWIWKRLPKPVADAILVYILKDELFN